MRKTVFITGITGFLGSHIGDMLVKEGYSVIATKRTNSNLDRCNDYQEKIGWVNTDNNDWQLAVIDQNPQVIIHAAWIGVEAAERNDWELQSKNLFLLQDILLIAQECSVKKIIGLGSQAEYGFINTVVTEVYPLNPTTAYGAVKIIASQMLKSFCNQRLIDWYWLRVFSVFGEKEGEKWLLPSVIRTIAKNEVNNMPFSAGDQVYAYMYVKNFTCAVNAVLKDTRGQRGIYNISASEYRKLKDIIIYIKNFINPAFRLDFGALPYRANQSMLLAGDTTLFTNAFGNVVNTIPFEEGIQSTIQYYRSNLK